LDTSLKIPAKKLYNHPSSKRTNYSHFYSRSQRASSLPEWRSNFINWAGTVMDKKFLLISFFIYTFGDIISLFVSTEENKKRNPEQAYVLFCQNLAFLISNLLVYWSCVFFIKKISYNAAKTFVDGFKPTEVANKAANKLSEGIGLLAGIIPNELIKPVIVSMMTSYFIQNLPDWVLKLFGLQRHYHPDEKVVYNSQQIKHAPASSFKGLTQAMP
jgi:hypothetical protein